MRRVEKLDKAVLEVKVAVGSTTRRLGLDLEKTTSWYLAYIGMYYST